MLPAGWVRPFLASGVASAAMVRRVRGWLAGIPRPGSPLLARPRPHLGEELYVEYLRRREPLASGPWVSQPAEVLQLHRHWLWRHAPAWDREAAVHVLPGELGLVRARVRLLGTLARWWVARRGLQLGILEGLVPRWGWAIGDFHPELVARIRELERRYDQLATSHAELVATRLQIRREVLEELAAAARAHGRAGNVERVH